MKLSRIFILFIIVATCLSGCNLRINKSIHIDDGKTVRGSQNAINGNIYIGSDCKVNGSCRSVNGNVQVGNDSKVKDLQSVNGRITIERDVLVRGDVESVNGPVSCDPGVEIRGGVTSINGSIDLQNTRVEKDVKTYNGDIDLLERTVIHGDIIIKKSKGNRNRRRRLKIEITDHSIVEGDIIVKDRNIDVTVILSNGGRVEGRVKNAKVIEG